MTLVTAAVAARFLPASPICNATTTSPPDKQPDHARSGELICVVDDDRGMRISLRLLFEAANFSVLTYASAAELLADDRRHLARCLIVDQHMSGMDGLTMVSALYEDGPKVPAILITGRLNSEITARATKLGITAVLEKPFPVTQLLDLVRNTSC
jgi:two-component system CheB/CheR fusion protein